MSTHIILINFTELGIRNIHQSPERSSAIIETAEKLGAHVKGMYWTTGCYDGMLIFDAPDDETAAALTLYLGSLGNVRTTSMRAYSRSEMDAILSRLK